MDLLTAVGNALTSVYTWIGTFITNLTSSTGSLYGLLPLFAVGIAISVVLLGRFMPSINRGKYLES